MATAPKKVSKVASKKKEPVVDTALGSLGNGDEIVNGVKGGKLVGDLDYRYENIFQHMVNLQWWTMEESSYALAYKNKGMGTFDAEKVLKRDKASSEWADGSDIKHRRTYFFGTWGNRTSLVTKTTADGVAHAMDGTPIPLWMSAESPTYPGHPGRINCTGSTESSTRLELERKYRAWQLRLNPSPAPAALLQLKDVQEHKHSLLPSLSAHNNWARVGGADGGSPVALEMMGIGFRVSDAKNARRGDVTQTYPEKGGHGVFVWDRRIAANATITYQQLSSQYDFTDGIGVNRIKNHETAKLGAWIPDDYKYCLRVLSQANVWQPIDALKQGVGRYYRLFPYWPISLGVEPWQSASFEDGGPSLFDQKGALVQTRYPTPEALPAAPPQMKAMFDLVEGRGGEKGGANIDGYYPISTNRTWHGGVHVPCAASQPVYAMSDGVVIAARMAKPVAGKLSSSFVLLRHEFQLAKDDVKVFYCLYMHLDPSKIESTLMQSRWLWHLRLGTDPVSKAKRAKLDKGEVVWLADPVAAGDIVGHVGGDTHPFLHWEVFSKDPIGDPGWQKISDQNDDLFVDLNDDTKKLFADITVVTGGAADTDGIATAAEIRAFFASAEDKDRSAHERLRNVICQHRSEWSESVDWSKLDSTPRFKGLAQGVKDESKRLAWWNALAGHGGSKALPSNANVWTYHPVTFSIWLAQFVGINPVDKQVVQDVKSFIPTALDGGAAPAPEKEDEPEEQPDDGKYRVWSIAGGKLAVFTTEAGTTSTGVEVVGGFLGKEVKESGGKKWVLVDAWASAGRNAGWAKKEGDVYSAKATGLQTMSVRGEKPGTPYSTCKVVGPLSGLVMQKNEKDMVFFRVRGWVCVSGSPKAKSGKEVD